MRKRQSVGSTAAREAHPRLSGRPASSRWHFAQERVSPEPGAPCSSAQTWRSRKHRRIKPPHQPRADCWAGMDTGSDGIHRTADVVSRHNLLSKLAGRPSLGRGSPPGWRSYNAPDGGSQRPPHGLPVGTFRLSIVRTSDVHDRGTNRGTDWCRSSDRRRPAPFPRLQSRPGLPSCRRPLWGTCQV